MEAVPRMPMISFELKQSLDFVEFGPTLKQYIRDHYGEDPAMYNKSCNELDQLRQTAVHVSHDFMGCSTLKKYYSQLQFLQGRFPLTELGEAAIPFTWEDVHSGREVTRADIKFEQACILYNIGALHSVLGAMDTRQSADGMKVSCTHFQCAAWAFEYLKEQFNCDSMMSEDLATEMLSFQVFLMLEQFNCDSMMSEDLASEMLSFQVFLMLAQAQECILEKSMADSRKSTITAKVSAQIVDFYRSSLKDLEKANQHDLLSSKRFKDWKRKIEMKILFYTCITNYYMGCQSEDQQKWGQCLAYFTLSLEKLTDCQKVAKGESSDVQESLRFTNDVVGGKHQAAKKDNDFVYHDKIPAADSLPEVKGASLVKGIPFNPSDPEVSGQDIFQKLVPMAAHEASSLYSEEKANLLRRISSDISEKNEALNQYLSSLQLDKSQLNPEPERLPQQLLEKCAALSVRQNAIKDLIDSMAAVSNVSTEVDMGIQEIQQLLQEESKAELEFQEKVGKRATNVILTEIAAECARFEEGHRKGSQSNTDLHKAMNTHINNLKLLSSPLDELQKALPSLDKDRDPESVEISRQLNGLLSKVEEMRSQRETLEEQLRKSILEDDITGALCKQEGVNKQALFTEQLKKHDQTLTFIRQNLGAQDNILRALTDTNAKYASVRMASSETIQRREQMIRDLINSYDVYEELMAKSQRGLEFYKKLEINVGRLLARCKAVCKVQQEEREQVYNRMKPKAPPPARPAVAKPSPQDPHDGSLGQPSPLGGAPAVGGAPLPVGGPSMPGGGPSLPGCGTSAALAAQPAPSVTGMFDGPKLKDYLPFMKPKTFGKKDGTPPISSADPAIQDFLASHSSLPPSGSASPVHLPQMSGSVPASPDHFRSRMGRMPDIGTTSQPSQPMGPDLTQGHMRQQPLPPGSRGHSVSPDRRGHQGSPDPRLGPGFSPSQQQFVQPGGQGQNLQSPGFPAPGPQRSLPARGQGQVVASPSQGEVYSPQQSQYVPLDQKWKRDTQPVPGQGQQPINQGQRSQFSQPTSMPQQPVSQVQPQYQGQFQGQQGMAPTGVSRPGQVQGYIPGSVPAGASPANTPPAVQQVPMSQAGQYQPTPQGAGMTFHPQVPQPHTHQHTVTHPSAAPGQFQPSLPGPGFGQQVRPRDVTNTVTAVETPVISPGKEEDASFTPVPGQVMPTSGVYGQAQGQMGQFQGQMGQVQGQFVSVPNSYQPQVAPGSGPQASVVSNLQPQHLPQQQQPGLPQQPYQPQQTPAGVPPVAASGQAAGIPFQQPVQNQPQVVPPQSGQPQVQVVPPQSGQPQAQVVNPQAQHYAPQPVPGQLGQQQQQLPLPPPQQLPSSQPQLPRQQVPGQFSQAQVQPQSQPLPAKPQAYQPVSSHSVPVGQHQAYVPQPPPQQVQQYPVSSQQGPQPQQLQQQFPQQGYQQGSQQTLPQQQQQPVYQQLPNQQQQLPNQQQQLPNQQQQPIPQQQPLPQSQAQQPQFQPQLQAQQQQPPVVVPPKQPAYSQQQPVNPQQQFTPQQSVSQQTHTGHLMAQQGLPVQTSLTSQHQQQKQLYQQQQGGQLQPQPHMPQGQQPQAVSQYQQPQQQQQPGQFQQGQMPQAQPDMPPQQQQQQQQPIPPRHSSPAHSQYLPPQGQAGPRFTTPQSAPQQQQQQVPYSMHAPVSAPAQGPGTFQGQASQAAYSSQGYVAPQSQSSITTPQGYYNQCQPQGQQPQQQNLGQGSGMQRPPAPTYGETNKNRQLTQTGFQGQGPQVPGQNSYQVQQGQGQPQNVIQPSQQGYIPQHQSVGGTVPNIPNASMAGSQIHGQAGGQGQVPGQGQMPAPVPGQMAGHGQMPAPVPGQMAGQGQMPAPVPGQMAGQGQIPGPVPGQMAGQGQGPYQQVYPPGNTGQPAILQPQILQPQVVKPAVSTSHTQDDSTKGQGQAQSQPQDPAAHNLQQGPAMNQNYQQGNTGAQAYPQGQAFPQNVPAQTYPPGPVPTQTVPQGSVPAQNVPQGQSTPVNIPQGHTPAQTYPQALTPTQSYQQVPAEQAKRDVSSHQPLPGKTKQDSPAAVTPATPEAHGSRQIPKPSEPPVSKQISLDRQISTASSLDEILSSSPDAKVERSDSLLAPKSPSVDSLEDPTQEGRLQVLTAQEIQHQKEDQLKNSSVRPAAKDPYKDRSKLDKFVAEVEKLAKFIEGFEKPTCSGPTPLDIQWKEVMEEQDKAGRQQTLAIARCYPMKNRDQDIMPYDESRVLITSLNDDYVNASWVNDLSPSCPKFIATQAPLPQTLVDFWTMVYEQGVEVLVTLSCELETGKKFPQYLPTSKGDTVHHGLVTLTLQSVKDKLCWTERIILLRHSETKTGRTLVHLHYNAWPISGFPEKVSHLLQFITEVHSFYRQQRSLMKPIVVHCSNGIGRTGMFVLIYVGMQEVNHGDGVVNLPDVAGKMLWRRRNLLLKKDQLKYCYEAGLYYAQDVLAKEGILVHKASFGDELPKPGVKSQSWEPGEDILFGAMSFTNLQTNVARLGTKLDASKLDQKLEALKNGETIEDSGDNEAETQTTLEQNTDSFPLKQTFTDSSLPDVVQSPGIGKEIKNTEGETEVSDLNVISDIEDKAKPSEGQDQTHDILQDLDNMMRMKIETKESASIGSSQSDKSKSGSKTASLTSSPAHASRETSSSPQTQKKLDNVASSLADLQDPSTFTIGISSSTKNKKITKADFSGEKDVPEPDPDDPLSSLDPRWTLK